jgi:hypothetical protein
MQPWTADGPLVRGWEPVQDFQAPPEKVSGDQNAERNLHQLDDQFVFAHRRPIRRSLAPPCLIYSGTAPLLIFPWRREVLTGAQQGLRGKRRHAI